MSSTSAASLQSVGASQTRYVPPSRRRDKPQVVCNSCRRRKLKCDRGRPCDNCTRRGLAVSCTYAPNASSSEPTKRPEPYAGVQDRIVQLENLVTTLMNSKGGVNNPSQAPKAPPTPSSVTNEPLSRVATSEDATRLSESFGHINLDASETSYSDSSHWKAVLDEISELKDYFEDVNESSPENGANTDADDSETVDSLLGHHEQASKEEILAMIPARQQVDRLLASFFSTANMSPVVVHCPTFLKQYEVFWQDPSSATTMWVGQLYAMMCLALAYYQFSGQDPDPQSRQLIPLYRTKCIQCLIAGQYTKGGTGSMETLLLYMQIEYLRSQDTETESWLLLGTMIRLALRMGYHRDPSFEPTISVFEGEMRRRRWAVISQFDVVNAAQFGLPRMIRDAQTDTREPRNLTDQDLYEDMKELPPPRGESDHTIIQFWTQKNKLVRVFGAVMELMASVHPFPYSEVVDLDKKLTETYNTIPKAFLPLDMSQTILDPTELILGRAFMEILYQKTRCVLHRRYMFAGKTNPTFAYSRLTTIDGALNVLHHQAVLDSETQPGGRLYDARWKLGAIIKVEFLLATTLLCLYLNQEARDLAENPLAGAAEDNSLRARVVRRLAASYLIWLRLSSTSKEARKAVQALRLVLGKAQKLGLEGSDAIAQAMNEARVLAQRGGKPNNELTALFTPPSSNGSAGDPASNHHSPDSGMELVSDLPDISPEAMIDPAAGHELFDMETWDLGDFNNGMDGFYDFGQPLTDLTA